MAPPSNPTVLLAPACLVTPQNTSTHTK